MRIVRGIRAGLASFGTGNAAGPEDLCGTRCILRCGMRLVRGFRVGLVAFGAGNAASPWDSCGTSGILRRKCDRSVGFVRD